MNGFKLALIQLSVSANKSNNVLRAAEKVKEAASKGASVISLPECFNSPYGTKHFPEYAESVPDGPTSQDMSRMAKDNGIYLVGGSIPERSQDSKLYNTCTVWSPEGKLLATHRKIHLFDIDIPGKITFKESEALSPGNSLTCFSTPWAKIGLGICYDIRFPDLAQIYARNEDCKLLLYPGAFNMTTGPAHWELLARARALDNLCYVGVPSPARDKSAGYVAWSHSSIVSPWGEVVAKAGTEEEIIYSDIDLDNLSSIRQQIPLYNQRRHDLYEVIIK